MIIESLMWPDGNKITVGIDCDQIMINRDGGEVWFDVWKDNRLISQWDACECEHTFRRVE